MIASSSGDTPSGSGRSMSAPCFEQHVHARDAVLARGIEQRRESAAVEALRPALGRHVTLVVAVRRAGVDAAPCAISSSIISGCRRADAHISAVWPPNFSRASTVAPWSSSRLRGVDVARARDGHQRRLSVGIRRVGVRAGFEQHLQDLGVADLGGEAHRRGAVVVREGDVGAGIEQTADLARRRPRRRPTAAACCRRCCGDSRRPCGRQRRCRCPASQRRSQRAARQPFAMTAGLTLTPPRECRCCRRTSRTLSPARRRVRAS